MKYQVEWQTTALKEYAKLQPALQSRVKAAAKALEDNPRPVGSLKMAGERDLYRVRVGDYRLIYRIKDDIVLIVIVRVRHRREAYRP